MSEQVIPFTKPTKRPIQLNLLPLLIAVPLVLVWYFQTRNSADTFVIAAPSSVAKSFVDTLANGTLLTNIGTTLIEIGMGFVIGVSAAFVLGYAITHSRLIEATIAPYAVAFQAVPIIAIVPTLIRFLGPGVATNGLICTLIVFFPMLISTMVGMRGVDRNLRDLMRSLMATRWQTFTKLEVPAALPSIFGGLKISTTLAVAGAVVAESLSSQSGLGYMIYQARYVYKTDTVLVGIFTLTALALLLYEFVSRLERYLLRWQMGA